jgi:molybdopterin synthase catalytic subunit
LRITVRLFAGLRELAGTARRFAEEVQSRYGPLQGRDGPPLSRVEVGETSVAIGVSAPHRQDALAACADAIEALNSKSRL